MRHAVPTRYRVLGVVRRDRSRTDRAGALRVLVHAGDNALGGFQNRVKGSPDWWAGYEDGYADALDNFGPLPVLPTLPPDWRKDEDDSIPF